MSPQPARTTPLRVVRRRRRRPGNLRRSVPSSTEDERCTSGQSISDGSGVLAGVRRAIRPWLCGRPRGRRHRFQAVGQHQPAALPEQTAKDTRVGADCCLLAESRDEPLDSRLFARCDRAEVHIRAVRRAGGTGDLEGVEQRAAVVGGKGSGHFELSESGIVLHGEMLYGVRLKIADLRQQLPPVADVHKAIVNFVDHRPVGSLASTETDQGPSPEGHLPNGSGRACRRYRLRRHQPVGGNLRPTTFGEIQPAVIATAGGTGRRLPVGTGCNRCPPGNARGLSSDGRTRTAARSRTRVFPPGSGAPAQPSSRKPHFPQSAHHTHRTVPSLPVARGELIARSPVRSPQSDRIARPRRTRRSHPRDPR